MKIKQEKVKKSFLKPVIHNTFAAMVAYIGVPLLLLSICTIFYFFGRYQEAKAATLVVQQVIHEQCNLESYYAEYQYYDPYPRTIYHHKLDSNVTIYCDFSSGDWECTCNE